MWNRWLALPVLLIALVALTACGGQQAAPTSAPPTSEPAAEPSPTPESLDSGGAAGASSAAGGPTFLVEISGDFQQTLTPQSNTVKLYSADAGGYFSFLQFGDEYGLPIVMISFSGKDMADSMPKAGQFALAPLKTGELTEPGTITASFSVTSDEEDPATSLKIVYSFDQADGSITIEKTGDVYGGSFAFTMKGKAFAATEYTKTVTVKGSFSGVKPE